MKKVKDTPVVEMKTVEQPQPQQPQLVQVNLQEAEGYLRLMDAILVDDQRAIPLRKHFITLIMAENEKSKQQQDKPS